jgi:hypothetical protein
MVNHFYCYGFDADFGPFFIKFATYFPYNAKVCLNGHHYAQQQAHATGIAFQALDNGLLSADDLPGSSGSATTLTTSASTRSAASGSRRCRTRSAPLTARPATVTTSQSCKPSSPAPRSWTAPLPAGSSSRR